jgi:outer membrane protein TolC
MNMKFLFRQIQFAAYAAGFCLAATGIAQPADTAAHDTATNNVYPIDLPTALRLANAQNLDVQIARQRLEEAKANHSSAVQQFFPWITPGAGFNRHEGHTQAVNGPILDVDKQSYTAGAAITAKVEFGDAIYQSLAAKQLVHAANHALETQQQDSALLAAQGYYDLAKAKALVDVINEALQISQNYQKQIHDAVGIGIAFKGDELRVQVQTEHYQIELRQAQEQQRVAAARLSQTLHVDSTVELVPQSTDLAPLTLVETNASLDLLVQRALHSRPELKANQALVSAARHTKNGAVYGPLIPTLGAQAFFGGLGGGPDNSTGSFGHSEDYFVGASWRIGPGGLFDFGKIDASSARLETSRISGEKLRDEVIRQVVESQTRTQSLSDQLATAKQNLTTASEELRLTRERKEYGVGVVLEDIQAQQDLTRARSDYLKAVADYDKAEFELRRVTGGNTEIPK